MKNALPNSLEQLPSSLMARAVVFCLLASLALGVVGLPIAMPKVKRSDEFFPCMNSPCGCASASQCWESCCCNTDVQKIAWAQRNGVTPPRFVVRRIEQAEVEPSASLKLGLCCAVDNAPGSPSTCSSVNRESLPSAVAQRAACCRESTTDAGFAPKHAVATEAPTKSRNSDTRVALWQCVQKCRGIDLVVSLLDCCWAPTGDRRTIHLMPLVEGNANPCDEFAEDAANWLDPPVPRFSGNV